MAENLTLIDFIRELLGLEGESKAIELRDFYQQNPQAALNEYGLGHLSPEDVNDAITLVQDNDTVSFDRNYDTGFDWKDGGWGSPAGRHHEDGGKDHGGDWGHKGGHDTAVREHVTNNHVTNNIDDRDTIIDQSVNQNIDTDGGDFRQTIDNNSVNATGDGSVAAGDDINGSTITTGSGNVVGNGNQVVSGDDNTTAFGSGSAVKGVSVDDGSAFSANGPASVDNSTNGSHNQSWSEDNDYSSTSDSGNVDTDNSVHTHLENNSETHVGSHNDTDLHFG
ncbi:hypothetical protein EV383_6107 [Pseudonocardia sediminis]|uniref:Uncharacterized protein n=1 Tax=Pseudonocardia sediminis TaxID=1397368 RepID=A0A4Q7V5Y3_PSEST|nr:hypothetical protein [Pseudonocardia sediminis]RZT89148.1 hypothetical protein EV383_6107 [Pseudonocardia sediminis]